MRQTAGSGSGSGTRTAATKEPSEFSPLGHVNVLLCTRLLLITAEKPASLRRATATTQNPPPRHSKPICDSSIFQVSTTDRPYSLLPYTALVNFNLLQLCPFIVQGWFLGKRQNHRKPLLQGLRKVASKKKYASPANPLPTPTTHTHIVQHHSLYEPSKPHLDVVPQITCNLRIEPHPAIWRSIGFNISTQGRR